MIEERTGGKVKIVPYFEESLIKGPDSWDGLQDGVADIATYVTTRTPGRFPFAEMVQKPGLGLTGFKLGDPDSQLASNALWAAYETFPEFKKEWAGPKLLTLHIGPSVCYHTTKKVVHTLEDAQGLKIQCGAGTQTKVVAALGSIPVEMPMDDTYLAMEKGMVDGYLGGGELLILQRFGELAKNTVLVDAGHGTIFWIAMNQHKWDTLPDDVKAVFEEFSGAWLADYIGKGRDKNELVLRERARDEMEHTFYTLPLEEARWTEKLTPLADAYAEELEAKRLPGYELLEFFKQYAKEHRK